jgi:hypothetical protein
MPDHSSERLARSSSTAAIPCSGARALVPCVYIGLQCPSCGDVRQTLAELPSSPAVCCPHCGGSCSFVPLGSGSTRRPLPFAEVRRPNATLMFRSDEIPPDDAPLSAFQQHAAHLRSEIVSPSSLHAAHLRSEIVSPSSPRADDSRRPPIKPFLSG